MITYIVGDIFDSPAQVIVNTVNTVGVMGKGLALSFKQRYPEMFEHYKSICEKHMLSIGQLMLFYEEDHWLLLFPTKESWRNPSKTEYIEKGLVKFVQTYAEKNITSIAFPRLGCGNGELNWDDVKPIMEKYLAPLPIDVYIYLGTNPDLPPEHKETAKTIKWLRDNAKDMSFNGLKEDLILLSTVLPYEFHFNDKKYAMKCSEEELTITTDLSHSYCISDEHFFELWDDIRTRAVFSIDEAQETERMVYALLYATGYLSKIKIYNEKTRSLTDGYQINAGLGRVLAFKGA